MEYQVKGTEHSTINISRFEDGVWISIHRHCGYASTHITREQAEQLRDALIALTQETADAAQ
jgi:hypothetical protein